MQAKPQPDPSIFFVTSRFARTMLNWFHTHRRDLPWRVPMASPRGDRPQPYRVLVSEAMLQQTQVATVVSYFKRFMERFPTIQDLSESDEQEVLQLWQGLGYYSRARNLRRAAQIIIQEFNSQIPPEVQQLMTLPGIGRYTAGAIGSIAYGKRAPILDGNVTRVLCRLFAIRENPQDKATRTTLWTLAEKILPRKHCGDFNQSLMELGATICLPRNPACLLCPVRRFCKAFDQGIQNEIPPAKKSKPTPLEHRWTFLIRDPMGRVLIEQRPPKGRWAAMWQFVTIHADTEPVEKSLGRLPVPVISKSLKKLGEVKHQLTHRRYRFEVFEIRARASVCTGRRWMLRLELDELPMSKPQLAITAMIQE